MKKIILSIIVSLSLFIVNGICVNAMSLYDIYRIECREDLARYDILDSDIDNGDLEGEIKRRDMFLMAYKVSQLSSAWEEVYDSIYDDLDKEVERWNSSAWNEDDKIACNFSDVEKYSKDYYLAFVLSNAYIMKGDATTGELCARFDDSATYLEALTAVCRSLSRPGYYEVSESTLKYRYGDDYTYFEYAEDIGLINTKSPADMYCPQIEKSRLNEKISVYDFYVLLDRALYIPSAPMGDYAPNTRVYAIDCLRALVGKRYDILAQRVDKELVRDNYIMLKTSDGYDVYIYGNNKSYPIEFWSSTDISSSDFENIEIGKTEEWEVKAIDRNGDFAVPYRVFDRICSIHRTKDGDKITINYSADVNNGEISWKVDSIETLRKEDNTALKVISEEDLELLGLE